MAWWQTSLRAKERELTGVSQWAAAYLHIWRKDPLRPQVKNKHAPVELESWPLSRLKVACWKGLQPNLFHLLFSPYLFFCFPNIAKWHQSELCFSGELISWNAQAGDAENSNLFRDGGWDKRARCFLKSASLVRAKLHCWVSKIPGSHLLKVYFLKSRRNMSRICAEASGLFSSIHRESLWKWVNQHFGSYEHFLPELLQTSWYFVLF